MARRGGEAAAAAGLAKLMRSAESALTELRVTLPSEPADRRVRPPGGDRLLTLPGFLVTRLVEFVVHAVDLAVSVGLPDPSMPPQATDKVRVLLTRIAARPTARSRSCAPSAEPSAPLPRSPRSSCRVLIPRRGYLTALISLRSYPAAL
jgi:hypothetical protein